MTTYFIDFWNDPQDKLLKDFSIYFNSLNNIIISNNPKFVFSSVFGHNQYNYNYPKIFFSGENRRRWKHFNYTDTDNTVICIVTNKDVDYSNYKKEKIVYYPFFGMHYDNLKYKIDKSQKKKFCCIVVSWQDNNEGCMLREELFNRLNKYKKVDSAGKCFNTTGYLAPRDTKEYFEWINQYKFMITFENSFGEGYVTEKLFNGLCGGVIPIYWGDDKSASEFFNSESYLSLENMDKLVETIIMLDNNDIEYDKINNCSKFLEKTTDYLKNCQNRVNNVINKYIFN